MNNPGKCNSRLKHTHTKNTQITEFKNSKTKQNKKIKPTNIRIRLEYFFISSLEIFRIRFYVAKNKNKRYILDFRGCMPLAVSYSQNVDKL